MKIAYFLNTRPDSLRRIDRSNPDNVIVEASLSTGEYPPEAEAQVADVDAFLIVNGVISGQIMAAAKKVKIIQRLGVGYESLDLEAADKLGIPCCNLAGINKERVSDYYMLHMLNLVRNFAEASRLAHEGKWEEARMAASKGSKLNGKTLGIIGLGNIGYELAKRGKAAGMSILYNDIRDIDPEKIETVGARFVEKDELYATADIVTINVNFNPTVANLIDRRALSLMKPTTYLICCARGGIIDEQALREALDADRLAGAGIDVYSREPYLADNPLLGAKNVSLTCHTSGVTSDGSQEMWDAAHANIRRVLVEGKPPQWIVNNV